ncbi:DUF4870 family protein [Sulfurospirillum sp. 1307]
MQYLEEKKIESTKKVIFVVYLLYALSYFFGITYLIGVIIAYVKKGDSKIEWLEDHFRWQINTFWVTFALSFVGVLTIFIGIGWFILLISMIWNIYRIVKGWLKLNDEISPYNLN